MITPLGPRGQVGVSKPMTKPSLVVLAMMIQYFNEGWSNGKPVRYSETTASIWTAKN